jgi:hypothetical protein
MRWFTQRLSQGNVQIHTAQCGKTTPYRCGEVSRQCGFNFQSLAQDIARFFFHGSPTMCSPDPEAFFGQFMEISNRDACHGSLAGVIAFISS